MTDKTVWDFEIKQGNTASVLKKLETTLLSVQKRLEQVAQEATKMVNSFNATASSMTNLASRASSTSKSVATLDSVQSKAAASAQRMQAQTQHLSTAMQEQSSRSSALSTHMGTTSQSMSRAGEVAGMAAKIGITALIAGFVALTAAIAASVPKAMQFDATLRKINALAGLSKEAVGAASEAILRMAGKVGKGPQDLADALYFVAGAGFDAKASMLILEASAKAATVGMTATEVVANAVTAALKAFPGMSVAKTMDMMTAAVSTGKTEWGTFGPAIGKASLFAQMAGARFEEANAALSTLTNTMPSTEQAATSLISLFQTTSSISNLAKQADDLNIAFDQNAYSSMNFIDRLKYLQQITGGNAEALKELLGQEEAMPAIQALLTNNAEDYAKALNSITNSAGAADEAFKKTSAGAQAAWMRATASLESLQVKIGTALLPVVNLFADKIAPMAMRVLDFVDAINQWIASGQAAHDITTRLQPAITYLAPKFAELGTALQNLGTILAPILASFGQWLVHGGVLQGMVVGIVVGIGLLIQGLTLLANGISNVIVFFSAGGSNAKWLWNILAGIGAFLTSTFAPVWQQLVGVWQGQLMPAIQQLAPLWLSVSRNLQVMGVILAVVAGIIVGVIGGVLTGLAALIGGIAQIFGGIIQVISGALQVVIGVLTFFIDLFTGKWDKLGADLGAIWQGVVTMFLGVWNIIAGLFNTFTGVIQGVISGFITGIVGFFQNLYNILVGHSIIPDMINGIINWFSQLPGRVIAFVVNLFFQTVDFFWKLHSALVVIASTIISSIVSWFQQLPGRAADAISGIRGRVLDVLSGVARSAYDAGSRIVSNIADGIRNAIGKVGDAIQSVTNFISSHLPHSPAKIGPLRDLELQGSLIPEQIAQGMQRGFPQLQSAIGDLTTPITASLALPVPTTPTFAASPARAQSNDPTVPYLAQMVTLLAQIVTLQRQSNGSVTTNNNMHMSPVDVQRMNQVIQSLSGIGLESVSRGAY